MKTWSMFFSSWNGEETRKVFVEKINPWFCVIVDQRREEDEAPRAEDNTGQTQAEIDARNEAKVECGVSYNAVIGVVLGVACGPSEAVHDLKEQQLQIREAFVDLGPVNINAIEEWKNFL